MSGIREYLNKRPNVAAAIAAGVLVVAAVILLSIYRSPSTTVGSVYFSSDDGKTFFAADAAKMPPFDHEGKPAVQAHVFRCGDEAPFVAYLAQYSDATRGEIASLIAKKDDPQASQHLGELMSRGLEVKKPGETRWVAANSPEAGAIMVQPACAKPGVYAVGVLP